MISATMFSPVAPRRARYRIDTAINYCSMPWNYYELEIEAELSLELSWFDYPAYPCTLCAKFSARRIHESKPLHLNAWLFDKAVIIYKINICMYYYTYVIYVYIYVYTRTFIAWKFSTAFLLKWHFYRKNDCAFLNVLSRRSKLACRK